MDSEPKQGNTEEAKATLFAQIKQRVGALLERKWRRASRNAQDLADLHGIPEENRDVFFAGFEYGYWNGAQDGATLNLSRPAQKKTKVH